MDKIYQLLERLERQVSQPYWQKYDFWITTAFGFVGLFLSYLAYKEAKRAKEAAQSAARTVKAITVSLELTDIVQKLDRIDEKIGYSACRELYNENNRKIKRLITPFKDDTELGALVANVETTLVQINVALVDVKPYNNVEDGSVYAVYSAVEGPFSLLSGQLGELIGLFERRTNSMK